jgi:uncharacterized membrane protein YfcA
MEWLSYALVAAASLVAGFMDAVVGGGGLILIPALLVSFPGAHPATLFGTNKSASIWGTAVSGWRFSQRVQLEWHTLLPAVVSGFMGSLLGAWLVTFLSTALLRKALPFVLLAVLVYTLVKKNLGQVHQPRQQGATGCWLAAGIGAVIGLYDGFFGPGTGSFLVFLFVRWLGYDFLNASAHAKVVNVATNLSALILFAVKGHVWWHFTLFMAVSNIVGSLLGSHVALRYGSAFVRVFFMVVVSALIIKTGYDAYLR